MDNQMLRDFCHHQACLTRAPERTTKHGKEQPLPVTAKTFQIIKTIDTMKKLHQLMGKTTSQHQNGSNKFTCNNINLNCKWAKSTDQKTQKEPTSISHPKNLPKGKEYLHNEESVSTNGQNSQLALDDNIKLTNININPKFKWIKCPNQRHRHVN